MTIWEFAAQVSYATLILVLFIAAILLLNPVIGFIYSLVPASAILFVGALKGIQMSRKR